MFYCHDLGEFISVAILQFSKLLLVAISPGLAIDNHLGLYVQQTSDKAIATLFSHDFWFLAANSYRQLARDSNI